MLFSTKNIFTFFLTLLILFFLLDRLNFKLIKLFQYINKLLKKINFKYIYIYKTLEVF